MNDQEILEPIPLNNKRTINGWAFFDWANSVYSLVISTAIFPVYFLQIAPDFISIFGVEYHKSSVYAFVVAATFLLLVFLSPILSGIADAGGKRMFFLKMFTIIGSIGCAALFFFYQPEHIWVGVIAFALGTIGYGGSLVFYNSYLPQISTEDQYDKVSAKGYAYGYVGSVLLLAFILVLSMKPELFGLATENYLPVRIGFLLVGLWWFGFAQITFNRMPKDTKGPTPQGIIKKGFRELKGTFFQVIKNVNVRRFLLSFLFFSAGVNTIIYVASIFASEEIGFDQTELIVLILILQMVAVVGAIFFAHISKLKGNKFALIVQIIIWMAICLVAYFTTSKMAFYILVGFVGMVLGGIQALARSSYTKLLEDDVDDLTSYYSFFDVLFKISIVGGTFLYGMVHHITDDMRNSMLSLAILFLIGLIVLMGVSFNKEKGNLTSVK